MVTSCARGHDIAFYAVATALRIQNISVALHRALKRSSLWHGLLTVPPVTSITATPIDAR